MSVPAYEDKPSDDEAPVMLELWGMQSTPSLTLFPVPLWLGMVVPNRILSLSQTECKQTTYAKLNWLEIELFDHLTM